MAKLGGMLPKITVAYRATGKRMNINEVDYDPELHVLWDEFDVGEADGPPTTATGDIQTAIVGAGSLGALVRIASENKLKLPGNIKNVSTAQTKLLAQLEG